MTSNTKITPVILCGGAGTRLGLNPPKQFQNLISNQPMILDTINRCMGDKFTKPTIVTNTEYRGIIEKLNIDALHVIYETARQNTGAAMYRSCQFAMLKYPQNPLLFLPCDHDIPDAGPFQDMIINTDAHHLTCFGKRPHHPETGYGYIETDGLNTVKKFHEKPNLETAKIYLQNKNIFWNMGIYFGLPHVFIEAFQTHAPDILNQSLSFDHAVMEHVRDAKMVGFNGDWQDVGIAQNRNISV
jgi:mannose-1-phosphate guanylyltransferase/mannose-6-phosphate isomerase